MNTIVCLKQVIDPEAPPADFKIDPVINRMIAPPGVQFVVDPFAECAIEAALRIKDVNGSKVTAISLGSGQAGDIVKKPLTMGADELILLEDTGFAEGDSWSIGFALAMAIKKLDSYDLIFCGRESSDWNSGQVGLAIAEILGLPSVTLAAKIDVLDSKAIVKKVTDEGYESVEVTIPAVITVSNEIGLPRYASMDKILAAARKKPIIWKPADIGLTSAQVGPSGRRSKLVKLFQPIYEGKCDMVEGETPEEAGINLALRLRAAKIL